TSRRSGSSCLLSLSPRTGRSGDKITAAANTDPNRDPRPTSSTPATARNPRARTSRSITPSQRILPARSSANIGAVRSGALFEPRGFPFESPQMIELCAPRPTRPHHVDPVDHLRVQRKDALHSIAEADLTHRDGLPHPGVVPRDHRPFKGL